MKFLRTVSTRRLLALIAAVVAVIAGGTAIAVAAGSGGPVPRAKPLARAIHDALAAPAITGITARVTFTNHLIDSSNIHGSDPLLTGATGRLWLSTDKSVQRLRLELQSDNGDAQAVLNNGSFWVYDPSSNTVYRGKLPAHAQKATSAHEAAAKSDALPSVAQIQTDLSRFLQHGNLSGAIPGDVAGQAAYTVRVSPKHDGGLLGSAALAWDAVRGIPLRFAIYARGSSSPVLELKVTNISYGQVPASDFKASPPAGAKVVNVTVPAGAAKNAKVRADAAHRAAKRSAAVTGAAAVAKHLHFKLVAPLKLVGLPQQTVQLLDWGGSPAALVTYGQNLGGIAVIEQTAGSSKTASASAQGDHHGLNLPTVSINGVTGQELDTALGTMVRFTRAGVAYTVLGSVPPAAADAAARGL
jgi:outer membrane lipoprotein-sorting protein